MRKIVFVLFMALMWNFESRSEVLDPTEALNRAMNTQMARRIKSSANAASPRLLKSYTVASQPTVYVFDRGSNAGFIVVSADDAITPLLGYSDDGDISAADIPLSVAYWLDSYSQQIERARQLGVQPLNSIYRTEYKRADILPKCKTAWGQVAPYNKFCPNGAVTGCVATAYAQILKTFEYPQHGDGSYSYTDHGKELSYDYDANPFDWADMLDTYTSGKYTDLEADAVANLMYACGVACDMNYGTSSYTAVTAPINHYELLGLSSQISFVERDYYTQDEWEDLMYEALQVGPIMYAGQNADGGHEFVCDGYRDGYFHINWGWDGVYNGYFKLSALDGASQTGTVTSNGYNSDQNAVIYMQPASKTRSKVKPNYQMTCESFKIKQSTVEVGKLISIVSAIYNKTTLPISGTLDLKVTDLTGAQVAYLNGPSISNAAFGAGFAYSIRIPSTLKDGAYIVSPGFTVSGETPRDVSCKLSGVQSYTMTVKRGVCTFSANTTASIDVSDLSLNTPIFENELFNVTAEITNAGDKEYNGFVAVALVDANTHEIISIGNYVPLTVPVDGTVSFDYGEKFDEIGDYSDYKIVLIDKQGNLLSGYLSVNVESGTPTFALTADNFNIADINNVNKYDISIDVDVTCSSGYFNNKLTAFIFPSIGGASIASLVSGTIFLNEGETKTVSFRGQISKLEAGVTYMVQVSSGSNIMLKKENGKSAYTRFTIGSFDASDVASIEADSQVVKTEYFSLQGVCLGSQPASSGIYIKVETLSNGERRSTRCAFRN